jgi:hypothetical protein
MSTASAYESLNAQGTSGATPWAPMQAEAPGQELKPSPRSFAAHHIFSDHGDRDRTFSMAGVTPDSVVFASITEINPTTRRPHLGLASMHVHNIVPKNNEVLVRLSIGWPDPLLTRVSLWVF